MIYIGTDVAEVISVNDRNKEYCIEIVKMSNTPTFVVCSDYDDDWGYEFYIGNDSEYERVKFCIMNEIFRCNTMYELLTSLTELFEDCFVDIIVEEECECNCEDCNCNCE